MDLHACDPVVLEESSARERDQKLLSRVVQDELPRANTWRHLVQQSVF